MSSFLWWLHNETTYSFHGDAPIAGLLPMELDALLLGHHVRQEQQSSDSADEENPRIRKRRAENRRGHKKAREKTFGDLGFQ